MPNLTLKGAGDAQESAIRIILKSLARPKELIASFLIASSLILPKQPRSDARVPLLAPSSYTYSMGRLPSQTAHNFGNSNAGKAPKINPHPDFFFFLTGETLTRDTKMLDYVITAVPQEAKHRQGPAYLVNGLTNKGWWCQFGIGYNQIMSDGSIARGFNIVYEVFDQNMNTVYPAGVGMRGGVLTMPGGIGNYDKIEVSLRIDKGRLFMDALNTDTGRKMRIQFPVRGDTFVGLNRRTNYNGEATGPMTEWWRLSPFNGKQKEVDYVSKYNIGSAFVWMRGIHNKEIYSGMDAMEYFSFDNGKLHELNFFGAREYASRNEFITGTIRK